jgi:ADP-glucose type glycogen/starch synthase
MNTELYDLLRERHRLTLPNVLLASAECSPLSKTGGLADVAGALPKAMRALGLDMRVITPYHRCIKDRWADKVEHMCDFYISLGWRRQYVGLERLELDGLCVYLIDNEYYFGDRIYRGGLAEGEQYCFFQRAVLESIPRLDFEPEILHCNDWHTAMLPFLARTQYSGRRQSELRTVLTIHNIAFQGKFGFDFVQDLLGVDSCWYRPDALEHYGCADFLKAGCVFADRVTTVSPSYAREIKTDAFGEGLQSVLISRGGDLSGIINGIDTASYDPETDKALFANYSAADPAGKAACRAALIAETGLGIDSGTPIIAMVTRMTRQKGFDLVIEGFDELMRTGCAFVLLGTGDERYEDFMRGAEARYPGRVHAHLTYDESFSRRVYAGADFLLMPSAFEPCGLSQMIAMRYGTLPIVHEVGGLRDTVRPYNRFTGEGNGFSFTNYSVSDMLGVVRYALESCANGETRRRLVHQAMETDFSFAPSAEKYAELFLSLMPGESVEARHDPFDERFRAPLGAVRCGESVRFFIETGDNCREAFLSAGETLIKMRPCSGGFETVYTAPDIPQVVWYSFRLGGGLSLGADGVENRSVRPFQLTVYASDFETPDWAQGAVMYQIFPDRFRREGSAPVKGAAYHRRLGRTIELHRSWDEPVKWQGGEKYLPNDFYGGTLAGIEKSLPELKAQGVDIIYLNPIFESDSNHRYDTADYMKIDPILGTNSAFTRLCSSASKLGMRVILDGVFSHTGDDSVYFNRRGVYPGPGAYQGEESKYYSWYDFREFPDDYRCWWGFKSLPEVNENDPGWQSFVLTGENSVVRTWLRNGASGYRLDVADELQDKTLEALRRSVKGEKPDSLIIGEVWEDATTKISYGERRRYALGSALDSVMNYPLRRALIDFALGRTDAPELCRFLISQKLNYPEPMYHCLMNLLSTHDTARIHTVLGLGGEGDGLSREQQAEVSLNDEQSERGRRLQMLCAAVQFALPGMPCVYYGDEEGMQGLRDPFCRAPYVRLDKKLREYYEGLAAQRHACPAMMRGDAAFCAPTPETVCILRFSEGSVSLTAANRGAESVRLSLSACDFSGAMHEQLEALPKLPKLSVGACRAVTKVIR